MFHVKTKINKRHLFKRRKRQVNNLFQEPVEQPLLSIRIAEKNPDRFNILRTSGTFCATKPVAKPLETVIFYQTAQEFAVYYSIKQKGIKKHKNKLMETTGSPTTNLEPLDRSARNHLNK